MTIEKNWDQQKINPIKKFDKILHLLWRNLVVVGPHVHLLVGVDTGEDEENPRTAGSSNKQSAESEDNGPLILLEISRLGEEL